MSVERYGGTTDVELQRQVCEGFSKWYEQHETKIADVIIAKFKKHSYVSIENKASRPSHNHDAKHILRQAFLANSSPTDAERDYLARQTGMTYKQVTVWFQNNRSRNIKNLPKRNRQQSSQHSATSPPQSASTMASLHEVEQHLRNPSDSPLAQHVLLPAPPPLPAPPIPPEADSLAVEENNKPAIVSRSHLMITEPRECAFDGHARKGNGDVDGVKGRVIKPLRKSRLAGKKPVAFAPSENPTTLEKCTTVPARHIKVYSPGLDDVQLNPTEILNRAQEQGRISSSSSIEAVDHALDGNASDSGNRSLSASSSYEVLALPLQALRSASGSSTAQVDASPNVSQAFKKGKSGSMIPMFNFLPPTPSHTAFQSTTDTARPSSSHSNPAETLQFDPIDFSSLLGLGARDAAQNLLKDLEELDFEQFLHSPPTSGTESPDEASPANYIDSGKGQVRAKNQGPLDPRLEYMFEAMTGKEGQGEVDPAIWEMVKDILTGSEGVNGVTTDGSGSGKAGVVPLTPAPTPVDGVLSSTENDPFTALSIDLSALLQPLSTTPANTVSAPATTVSQEPMSIELTDAPEATPSTGSADAQIGIAEQEGKKPDWQGLLDFTEMFDAFWGMVDAQEGARVNQQ
ncbi:hypothetical protein NCC49_006014 [Naganishia albida]|nr:hypothetical protein NCC49_006014 [Naganishia albida]